ncbi:MAG: LPS export ABC transporter periplasmic protein LptC [Azospirillaceae bacterium]
MSATDPPADSPAATGPRAGTGAAPPALGSDGPRVGPPGPRRRFTAKTRRTSGTRGYSAFVSAAKFVLPLAALGLIAIVVMWPSLDAPVERDVTEQQASSSSMVNPRFSSTDDQGRPYTITGTAADGVPGETAVVDIESPEADVTLEDGTWLALMADQGRFDRDAERIHLQGNVEVFRDDGYAIRTHEAHVDLQAGESWGDRAVSGHGPDGRLEGSGFRIAGNGDTIVVTGPARLVLEAGGGAGADGGGDLAGTPEPASLPELAP